MLPFGVTLPVSSFTNNVPLPQKFLLFSHYPVLSSSSLINCRPNRHPLFDNLVQVLLTFSSTKLNQYTTTRASCALQGPFYPYLSMAAATLVPWSSSVSGATLFWRCLSYLLLLSFVHIGVSARRNLGHATSSSGPLQYDFYRATCPSAESIVRQVVGQAVADEARMAGSLLRLHFHDCFVQGCDASLLLKTTPGVLEGEQEALPNNNSVRGFNVVDDIKAALEKRCPGVVSCADVLAMAARDSVAVSGGPSYRVLLGRRDSLTASRSLANQMLPGFNFNVSNLVTAFASVGLSTSDMVVLSGGHTIGKANCNTFAARLTSNPNDPTALDATYRQSLSLQCPAGASSNAFVDLDVASPTLFDNRYYSNLLANRGLLHSDQVLYSTSGVTHDQVTRYAASQSTFFKDFAAAMIKMGNISPLTGSQGEIRSQCGFVNSASS